MTDTTHDHAAHERAKARTLLADFDRGPIFGTRDPSARNAAIVMSKQLPCIERVARGWYWTPANDDHDCPVTALAKDATAATGVCIASHRIYGPFTSKNDAMTCRSVVKHMFYTKQRLAQFHGYGGTLDPPGFPGGIPDEMPDDMFPVDDCGI